MTDLVLCSITLLYFLDEGLCGMKDVGIFSVVLLYTFIRKNLCILLVQCREIVTDKHGINKIKFQLNSARVRM